MQMPVQRMATNRTLRQDFGGEEMTTGPLSYLNPGMAHEMFRDGYDTIAIAKMVGCTEAEVYNVLAEIGRRPERATGIRHSREDHREAQQDRPAPEF
jgi:hypothetical protein